MRSPTRHVLILAVLFVVCGVVYGLETNRWAVTDDLVDPAKFDALGDAVGRWKGDPATVKRDEKEKTFTWSRRYAHADGRALLVSVVTGPPGFVAAHTPDVCYPGSGFKMRGEAGRAEVAVKEAAARSWCGDFTKHAETGPQNLKIHWSWATEGRWEAPAYPRLYFARARALTKCYMIIPYAGGDPAAADEAYRDFAPGFLAELNTRLFAQAN